jgi:hypothetical protein
MMLKPMKASAPQHDTEPHDSGSEGGVNTDNLSPKAARRFERFITLVDRFEKAASSGAISPPPLSSLSETQA